MQSVLCSFVFLVYVLGTTPLSFACEPCVCCGIGKDSCLANGSVCVSCLDGYWSGKCRESCPKNCVACATEPVRDKTYPWIILLHVCTKCPDGKYLGDTDEKKTCSLSCPTSCKTCTSPENCTSCKTGYYHTNGKCEQCSKACLNQICNWENGYCEKCPSANFTGNFCENCLNGIYGSNCDMSCPINCRDSACNRTTGTCLQCASNFEGDKCDRCTPGHYGADCKRSCPTNCKDRICTKDSGVCISCFDGFNGPLCDKCSVGFYSENCSLPCFSPNCYGNVCNRSSGLCEHNEVCAEGWFGEFCNNRCSNGCKVGNCSIDNGICFNGCKNSYSGDKCCVQNKHCLKCLSTTECLTCASGFYGTECQLKCSANCTDGCLKISGQCNGCSNDNFGTFCTGMCSGTCMPHEMSTRCEQNSGKCLFGCIDGYYRDMCKTKCISTCNDMTCDRLKGLCLNDEDMYTSEDVVKKLAIAVVATCLISVMATLAFEKVLRFVRGRLVKTETDIKGNPHTREQTGTYETLEAERTNQMTYYDTVEDTIRDNVITKKKNRQKKESYYVNTNV